MAYLKGKVSGEKAIAYIVAQLIGAIAAVQWYNYYDKSSIKKIM
jgi:glycerol uptake facilitator-like aquaporin